MRVQEGLLLLLMGCPGWGLPALAQDGGQNDARVAAVRMEAELWRLANRERAARGVAPLAWDEGLARAAREHARWMAEQPGELRHQYPGEAALAVRAGAAGARFAVISENLARGEGASAEAIEGVWVRSAVHRQNLLDPTVTAVGLGVLEIRGVLFVVEDFAREAPVLAMAEIERRVAAEVGQTGIGEVGVSEAARRSCAGEDGARALVVGWDGTEPTRLPDRLVQRLRSGAFRRAEVGACASERVEAGFQTYRVAVLLF